MFIFTKAKKLATNEKKEYEILKFLIMETTDKYGQRERHRIFPEWHGKDSVKLGVTLWDTRLEIEFFVETRSDVAYFGDQSKELDIKEILEEMEMIDNEISNYIREHLVSKTDFLNTIN